MPIRTRSVALIGVIVTALTVVGVAVPSIASATSTAAPTRGTTATATSATPTPATPAPASTAAATPNQAPAPTGAATPSTTSTPSASGTPNATSATGTPSATSTPSATGTPTATGTLTLLTQNPAAGHDLTFSYSTDTPLDLNWVGVYNTPSSGPVNQQYVGGSTAYTYTKDAASGDDTSGTVTVSGAKLTAGHDITAYFLYNDGYTWLAQPITFQVAASPAPSPTGTLTLDTKNPIAGQPLTFSYSTDTPLALNWVGVYNDPADGPTSQSYNSASTAYTYTGDNASGTLTVSGAGLTSGHDITAYFLYNDGYTWLAKPVTFQVSDPPPYDPTPTTSHFVTDDVTEAATEPVTAIDTSVGGLWFGAGGTRPAAAVSFVKTSGSSWLKVSPTGVITGTTPSNPARAPNGEGTVTITATDTAGVTGTITVEFPLIEKNAKPEVKAATLDMWDGGSHVAGSREKLVRSIVTNRLDVVGLQSTLGTQATAVAKLLGWGHVETAGGQAIVSRYPLAADRGVVPTGLPAIAALVNVDGTRIQVWSAQLDSDAFGPAAACAATTTPTASAIVAREKSTLRYSQAKALSKAITKATTEKVPNLVLGDLESPAASDWTKATAASHCCIGAVSWPVPRLLSDAGLVDSYRSQHPNAAKDSGQTTSIFPPVTSGASASVDAATAAGTSSASTAATDGPERLDYVDFSGKLRVDESHTLVDGFPQGSPSTAGNAWISNRAAVVTTFTVQ